MRSYYDVGSMWVDLVGGSRNVRRHPQKKTNTVLEHECPDRTLQCSNCNVSTHRWWYLSVALLDGAASADPSIIGIRYRSHRPPTEFNDRILISVHPFAWCYINRLIRRRTKYAIWRTLWLMNRMQRYAHTQ